MRTTLATAALLLLSWPLAAQGRFEGTVTYRVTGERGAADMTWSVKGDKTRVDMSGMGGQEMYLLMETGSGTFTSVMPGHRMYMTMDLRAMAERMGQGEHAHTPPPKITATGKTETIAGRTCENYLVGDEPNVEVCAAKGMGFFLAPGGPMGRGRGPMASLGPLQELAKDPQYAKLFAEGFFPLRVTSLEGGARKVVMEATRIEARALDDSLFVVPAGYTEMKMGEGMGRP
ncbi:MAG TPA: DUF4412 domain-containing protein [Gemmatimonadales bacterium]|jgi:hypothetical protein|nr:DUF4412 domain-containing protein [Gemmatimonadales bacterium]